MFGCSPLLSSSPGVGGVTPNGQTLWSRKWGVERHFLQGAAFLVEKRELRIRRSWSISEHALSFHSTRKPNCFGPALPYARQRVVQIPHNVPWAITKKAFAPLYIIYKAATTYNERYNTPHDTHPRQDTKVLRSSQHSPKQFQDNSRYTLGSLGSRGRLNREQAPEKRPSCKPSIYEPQGGAFKKDTPPPDPEDHDFHPGYFGGPGATTTESSRR